MWYMFTYMHGGFLWVNVVTVNILYYIYTWFVNKDPLGYSVTYRLNSLEMEFLF